LEEVGILQATTQDRVIFLYFFVFVARRMEAALGHGGAVISPADGKRREKLTLMPPE
jgi:hypothetical protein